jgi:hypothetical protein
MAQIILSIINEGLKFINQQEALALQNRIMNLKGVWDAEIAKGADRDDSVLDGCERELRDIADVFVGAIKSASPSNKS